METVVAAMAAGVKEAAGMAVAMEVEAMVVEERRWRRGRRRCRRW